MNYKEKYKQALERAREQYNKRTPLYDIEYIFPELKESEEERIRKAIKKALQVKCDSSRIISDEPVTLEEALAWLEKQGEKDPCIGCTNDKGCVTCENGNLKEINVKPKFKVGDWVVNSVCFPMQIASIKDGMYIFTKGDAMSVLFIDGNFHLWTIQDAIDGDVLCYHVSSTTFFLIGIFKRVANKDELWGGTYRNYAQYGGYGSIENYTLQVALGNDELHHCGSIACPATKEQRDLLFLKMKEAGYEWDSEKKELKNFGT